MEPNLKELSKKINTLAWDIFFLEIKNASWFVIIDELHKVFAFFSNLYLLKYLSDQYSSRYIFLKLPTTSEIQITKMTPRKSVYIHRSRNYTGNNKQAVESLNLEAFVGVRYF